MAARFPVSATPVAYQIKAAWASKIHVLYWPAGADSLHRLRAGETSTTIITRASSGATYNSSEGRIEGTASTYFTDSISGGYGGLREVDNYTAGASFFGDIFNGVSATQLIGSLPISDGFDGGFKLKAQDYVARWGVQGNSGSIILPSLSDDVAAICSSAVRHNQSDPTNPVRVWENGAEVDSGFPHTPSSTSLLGDTARPFYIGGNRTGTGNTKVWFEAAWFGAGSLSDADMVAITDDPSQVIEVYTVPSDASGNVTADSGSVSGGVSSYASEASGNVTADSGSVGGSAGPQPGTITSEPLYDNAGNLKASVSLNYAAVYHPTTGALVVRKTGLSTNGAGVYSFSDAAIVQGIDYRHDWETADGTRCMPQKAAA